MTVDKRILIRTIDTYSLIFVSEEDVSQFENKHTVETVSVGDASIQYVSESYDVWRDNGIVSSPSGAHGYLIIHKVSALEKVFVRPYGAYFGDLYLGYEENNVIHYYDYYGYDIPLVVPRISVIGDDFTISTNIEKIDDTRSVSFKKLISSTNINNQNDLLAKISSQAADYSEKFGNLDNSLQAASLLITQYLKDAALGSAKAISVGGESAGKVGKILEAVSEFAEFAGAVKNIPSSGPGREVYEAGAKAIASLLVAGAVGEIVTVSGISVLLAPIVGGVAAPIVIGLAVAFVVDGASGPIIKDIVKYSFDKLYENSDGPASHAPQQIFFNNDLSNGGNESFTQAFGLLDQPPKIDWKLDLSSKEYTTYNDQMLDQVEFNMFLLGYNTKSNIIKADYANDKNILIGGAGSDIITGGSLGEIILGSYGDDLITPNQGSDLIDGGGGVDTVILSDIYSNYDIDDSGKYIYLLNKVSMERLSLSEIEIVKFTNGFEYKLKNVFGTSDSDEINGSRFDNIISGMNGDDRLDGMLGADTMIGGAGNDTYIVDNARDAVLEKSFEGDDRVISSVSYALSGNVEMLTLSGVKAINATGNDFTNRLVGNGAANVLNGGVGADVMEGGGGNDGFIVDQARDQVFEASGGGVDRVYASTSYTLQAGQEIEGLQLLAATGSAALNLTGNEISQSLVGNNGNNVIDGGIGRDAMTGRGGNDTFIVDNIGDRITETAGGGRDTVLATGSYALAAGQEIEALQLLASTGSARLNLSGNEFGQSVVGNIGANVLDGRGGADVLTGRGGADSFQFSTALGETNVDRITDFAVEDTIRLSKSIFSAIAPGQLAGGAFKTVAAISTAKLDADDRIVYKPTTGELFYDADGSGSGAAVKFAVLDNKAALTAADFLIV